MEITDEMVRRAADVILRDGIWDPQGEERDDSLLLQVTRAALDAALDGAPDDPIDERAAAEDDAIFWMDEREKYKRLAAEG